jgi:hypothetical protein
MTAPGVHKCHRLLRVPPTRCSPCSRKQRTSTHEEASEGLPMPREPAYVDKRSQDGVA